MAATMQKNGPRGLKYKEIEIEIKERKTYSK
jgi:hypothetical protein